MTLPENNQHEATVPEITSATPHELVQVQTGDLDYSVDEYMDEMEVSDTLMDGEELEADEEADALESDNAGTSYDVLD